MSVSVFEARDCYSASYGTVLRMAGLNPIVLGGQWGFRWRPDARLALGWVSIDPMDWHSVLRLWYDVDITREEFPDVASALDGLSDPAYGPAVVPVDSYHLPFSATYRRDHYPHAIVIAHVSGSDGYVVDGYRGYRFEGELNLGVLRRALDTSSLDRLGAMPLLTCAGAPVHEGCVPTVRVRSRRAGQAPSVATAVAQLTGNLRLLDDAGAADIVGAEAVVAIGRTLHASVDKGIDGSQVELLSLLGTVSSQRSLNAAFLTWLADTGRPALTTAAEVATVAARQWLMLRNVVFLRASGSAPARADVLRRAADQVIGLAGLESDLYAALRAAST